MRRGLILKLFAAAVLCMSNAVPVAAQKIPSKDNTQTKAASAGKATDNSSENAAALFSKSIVFRGNLGDMRIQAAVRPKEIIDEGLEGEYFIFGRSQKILLAGELEGENIFLEESENGTNISGQWEGKLQDGSIQGTWTSADGSVTKPFNLTPIRLRPVRGK
ncbi:MAG: hypothetical protein A3I66_13225 [Burkholderiales bacterium RIFCSPLOWO2_02_FULL_57_36]|nr:MAG: hypothetical protein A3I66_13225 [Burkholderiales bacterium RIFCSPLOWO2_02_FULL_57_36]